MAVSRHLGFLGDRFTRYSIYAVARKNRDVTDLAEHVIVMYWLCGIQIWISWRKRNLFDMEWLAEERRKHDDLQREKWRHVEEHMRMTSGYQARMQGKSSILRLVHAIKQCPLIINILCY